VLSPPTASEPFKPVQQAANEVIKTLTFSDNSTPGDGSSGSASSGGAATSSTPDDDKKTDKVAATNDKTGTQNDATKKLYCN
jgi:hypothetical protein